MKKYFVSIAICVLCFFAIGIVAANAQVVYGIKHPPSGSSAPFKAYIYEIDLSTSTCGVTQIAVPELPTKPSASWNGNAYDIVNDRYYFSQFDNSPKT